MRGPVAPDELLGLAQHLTGRAGGPAEPPAAWLRRAISTAYYALFHELVSWSVARALSEPDREQERWAVSRWFQHAEIRQVSLWVSALAFDDKGVPAGVAALFGGADAAKQIPAELQFVAESFVALHKARQSADYDPALDLTRADAITLIDLAATAISTWRAMPSGHHRDLFLMLMLGGPRLVRAR